MGDLLKSNPIFAKVGFDGSNQWILYADGMQDFFNWMANNITESNIATDSEIYEENDLKESGQWCDGEELENCLKCLEDKHAGILSYTDKDVNNLKNEIKELEDMQTSYSKLNEKLEKTKANLNRDVSDLELSVHDAENRLKQATTSAMDKARELQDIQKNNLNLNTELRNCFTETQMPPLFIHEMPLDDYFTKSDLFQEYLKMYLNSNLKTKIACDSDECEGKTDQTIDLLKNLERQLYRAEYKLAMQQAVNAGYRTMREEFDLNKVPFMTPGQLKSETRDLKVKKNHSESSYFALESEMKTLLQSLAQQQIENILYENTKIKLERASKRLEAVKYLEHFVADSVTNAELVWILMQLDLEKVKNFCENSTHTPNDSQACMRRVETMLQYKSIPDNYYSEVFMSRMADQLVIFLQLQRPNCVKSCLYEYERFCRLSNYTLKGIVEKKHYSSELKVLENLKTVEKIFSSYVFDGPIDGPMFKNVKFLEPIYEANRTKEDIEKTIRRIRCDIQANITDKMNSDRFWRFQQLLWIWFLTEPKKVIQAIEEARKSASKTTSVKMLAGIKRKDNEN